MIGTLIISLFNDAFSSSDYSVEKIGGLVSNKLKRCEEREDGLFEVLSRHSSGGTEANDQKPQSGLCPGRNSHLASPQ
jgi:hypothetical protein